MDNFQGGVKSKAGALQLNSHIVDMNSASVSVIIPCYRCSETIARALASVATQTMLPKEVILVEDASPDNGLTLQALNEQAAKYADSFEVKVIVLNHNQGAANARNVGWSVASQPYIALLDADDAWHPQKIEVQYQFMLKNPQVVLCGHDAKMVTDDSQPDWPLGGCDFKTISKTRLLISNPFVTPSVMMKKDIVLRFNPTKRYVDDHLLWLQIAFDDYKVVKLSPALVAIYKPMFGASGLSSHLWAMEKAELGNYWLLYKNKNIGFILVATLSVYSLAKYLRRLIIVSLRRAAFVKN
ncbi:MAG: glycosyltransferase family 2 protein [Methylotenera sp.]|nr:glycosyltransferase family 2 protein [Methylotenera sp.]